MSPMLATASAVISLALVAYTIGVFSERRSGELKRSHLVFFWLGLICDSTGTGLMSIMAQNSGGTMSPLHPVTGFLAIALMLFHAAWATYVVFRGNEKTRRGFHALSIGVWLVWLVPYFVGMLIGIPAFHVSGSIALAAAAGVEDDPPAAQRPDQRAALQQVVHAAQALVLLQAAHADVVRRMDRESDAFCIKRFF